MFRAIFGAIAISIVLAGTFFSGIIIFLGLKLMGWWAIGGVAVMAGIVVYLVALAERITRPHPRKPVVHPYFVRSTHRYPLPPKRTSLD